jgi:hypothetical protein
MNQIQNRFRLRQVNFAVQESSAREFPRLCLT